MTPGFTAQDVPALTGRTVVITGANTGIGYQAARALSARGARVLLACRSEQRALQAIAGIKKANGPVDIDFVELDLGDLSSVRRCAALLQREDRIDLLINNAGIMGPPLQLTVDGFESHFGINHLGPFAFTGLLLARLGESPAARVVNTSSLAHRSGTIRFHDINAQRSYSAGARYSMSKLANLLFSYELQRRLEAAGQQTLAVACHPGIANTDLTRHLPAYFRLLAPLMSPFLNTPAGGALPTLCAATSSEVTGGDYYGPGKHWEVAGPAIRVGSSVASHDLEAAQRLWDLSVEMTGVDPGI